MIHQREIVEVPYQLPDGSIKPHMALVVSSENLQEDEDGMFYAVLISSKNYNPQYTIEIKGEWLMKPLSKQSFFVTHILNYFSVDQIIQRFNNFIRQPYYDKVIDKVISSIFDIDIS